MDVFKKIVLIEKVFFKVKIHKCSIFPEKGAQWWYFHNKNKFYKVKCINNFSESRYEEVHIKTQLEGKFKPSEFYLILKDCNEDDGKGLWTKAEVGSVILIDDCI